MPRSQVVVARVDTVDDAHVVREFGVRHAAGQEVLPAAAHPPQRVLARHQPRPLEPHRLQRGDLGRAKASDWSLRHECVP